MEVRKIRYIVLPEKTERTEVHLMGNFDDIIKPFTNIQDYVKVKCNNLIYATSEPYRKNNDYYVRACRVEKGCKIYCSDKSNLYELETQLNEMGYQIKVDNCNLSIAILEEPNNLKELK